MDRRKPLPSALTPARQATGDKIDVLSTAEAIDAGVGEAYVTLDDVTAEGGLPLPQNVIFRDVEAREATPPPAPWQPSLPSNIFRRHVPLTVEDGQMGLDAPQPSFRRFGEEDTGESYPLTSPRSVFGFRPRTRVDLRAQAEEVAREAHRGGGNGRPVITPPSPFVGRSSGVMGIHAPNGKYIAHNPALRDPTTGIALDTVAVDRSVAQYLRARGLPIPEEALLAEQLYGAPKEHSFEAIDPQMERQRLTIVRRTEEALRALVPSAKAPPSPAGRKSSRYRGGKEMPLAVRTPLAPAGRLASPGILAPDPVEWDDSPLVDISALKRDGDVRDLERSGEQTAQPENTVVKSASRKSARGRVEGVRRALENQGESIARLFAPSEEQREMEQLQAARVEERLYTARGASAPPDPRRRTFSGEWGAMERETTPAPRPDPVVAHREERQAAEREAVAAANRVRERTDHEEKVRRFVEDNNRRQELRTKEIVEDVLCRYLNDRL